MGRGVRRRCGVRRVEYRPADLFRRGLRDSQLTQRCVPRGPSHETNRHRGGLPGLVCQKWFLPDVEAEELEVMGGAVPDADGLLPDAITRQETQQVATREGEPATTTTKKIS